MTLAAELEEFKKEFLGKVPQKAIDTIASDMERLAVADVLANSLKVGDKLPLFELPDAKGQTLSIKESLANGPVVIAFYRGTWCPYCNLQFNALKNALPEIEKLGASLIAISPQLPDASLSMVEKHQLPFDVLSDVGNKVARQFGIVFALGEALRPLYQSFGLDIPAHNGDDSYELPVPATYVVNAEGVIIYAFAELDYTQRAEPSEIIEALKK